MVVAGCAAHHVDHQGSRATAVRLECWQPILERVRAHRCSSRALCRCRAAWSGRASFFHTARPFFLLTLLVSCALCVLSFHDQSGVCATATCCDASGTCSTSGCGIGVSAAAVAAAAAS